MYLIRESAVPVYAQPFSRDAADEIGRLIEKIRLRKSVVIEHWHKLCASSTGTHRFPPHELLEDTYVPRMRSAIECLARGDKAGFMKFGRALGAEIADAGVSFAAMVAHASFLKDCCAQALADDPAEVAHALIALERPLSCLVTAAAEGYYNRADCEPADDDADVSGDDPDEATGLAPTATFFHGMVGRSEAMQRVFAQIKRGTTSTAPILILGETGTGKELVARAIHQAGPRRDGPFVALNCAALPRELIESELFGHKRGAFSGAVADCLGLVRGAECGTLLLDEITEMGPDLQAKLLRVLQERAVRPVGAVKEEPIDVRIIASTNRDPEAALRAGILRPDLYYRLCGSALTLPSLRTRREDIPALVEYQLSRLNARDNTGMEPVRGITPSAMQLLIDAAWPGNVRELFNVVENAFTMCSSIIRAQHLDLAPGRSSWSPSETAPPLPTFHEHERSLIERVLQRTRGNKLRAARELGISRKKLYARMARYGLMAVLFEMLSTAC